jgi:hypothetical protein
VRSTLNALLAERDGAAKDAVRDYAAAAEAWHSGKSPHEEGLALLGLSRCLLTLRRKTEADTALTNAHALFEGIGSRLALAEVDRLRQTV